MRFDQGGRCRNNRVRHQFQATVECKHGFRQATRVLRCRSKHSHGGRNSNSCSRSCIEVISCEIEDGERKFRKRTFADRHEEPMMDEELRDKMGLEIKLRVAKLNLTDQAKEQLRELPPFTNDSVQNTSLDRRCKLRKTNSYFQYIGAYQKPPMPYHLS